MNKSAAGSFTGSNGITYGLGRSSSWGTRGSPIIPRVYRRLFPDRAAPAALRDVLGNKNVTWADLGRGIWAGGRLAALPKSVWQAVADQPAGRPLVRPDPLLPKSVWQAVADQLRQAPVPYKEVIIPAGLPLDSVANMALRIRTRTGIRRLIHAHGAGPLGFSLLVEDLMEVPSVGIITVLDLLCVMESAELDSLDLQTTEEHVNSGVRALSDPLQHFRELAVWALSETDAVTLGDAVLRLVSGPTSVEEWQKFSAIELRALGEPPPHPYHILDQWASSLPDLQRRIFEGRFTAPSHRITLTELAAGLGYTRERIRQLQNRLLDELRNHMRTPQGRPVGWRIDSMRAGFGVAVPEDHAMEFLSPPKGSADYSKLFLYLGGPYSNANGWLVLKRAIKTDPTQLILEQHTDRFGRVSVEQARQKLSSWGLRRMFHLQWLTRDQMCRWFDDELVRWKVPMVEKLHYALSKLAAPSTAEELLAYLGERKSLPGTRDSMSRDRRFIRSSKRQWALSEWGLPEYLGIALSINQMLEDAGGSLPISRVVDQMHTVFGTSKQSADQFCRVPKFVIEGENVRVRREGESYAIPAVPNTGVPGMFSLENDRIGILLAVNKDTLRGSGRAVGHSSPTLLQMTPGSDRTFHAQSGHSVRITYSETALTGPTLGSTRKIAKSLGAKKGHWLTLILNLRLGLMEARVTHIDDHHPSWTLVERLTGVPSDSGLEGLGRAMGCDANQVRETLDRRGDTVVLNAIPSCRPHPLVSEEPVKGPDEA